MFYQYWVVRYVPDPIRGEFVNIALLVGKDGHDWAFRPVSNLQRASRLGGDPTIAKYWLGELEKMVGTLRAGGAPRSEPSLVLLADSERSLSAAAISRIASRLNNAVQISAPYPMEADSAAAGLSMLFEHLIADPQVKPRELFGTRVSNFVSTELRRVLPDSGVALRSRPQIRVGTIPRTANFAITDNAVEQITNAWSFNLSDVDKVSTEIQAWVAHMDRLRRRGGILESRGQPPLSISPDVQLRVVYEEPRQESARPALEIAKEVWKEVPDLVAYSQSEQHFLVRDAVNAVAV
ncbi:hypothetical protein GCM10009688_10520 [Arthrobacter gandavensis]|uniref:DUF3037 domain-containing protein n=1 Tax=Arthrobacter gandavensis TaxID=169960 RepID=A0ABP5AB02_9MICC